MSEVNINVAIQAIFDAIDNGQLTPQGKSVTVDDSFITYSSKSKNVAIDPDTTPPTITLARNDTVDFVIEPAIYNDEEVDFEYFDDPYLSAKPDGIAKHIDRYETPPERSTCPNITMTIHVEHQDDTWAISWDPTIEVGDP